MDDKEKEKFGVIIDKSDQNKDDQSAVESTSDTKKEEETSNEQILQTSDTIIGPTRATDTKVLHSLCVISNLLHS